MIPSLLSLSFNGGSVQTRDYNVMTQFIFFVTASLQQSIIDVRSFLFLVIKSSIIVFLFRLSSQL